MEPLLWGYCAGTNCTAEQSDSFRRQWDRRAGRLSLTAAPSPPAVRPPCTHEGRTVSKCPKGDAARDVIWCELHKAGVKRAGVCRTCPDHQTKAQQFTRHLCYHLYPVSQNGAWQRNVSRLVERLRLFDGKIIVAIVTDPPSGRKPDPTGPHPPDGARDMKGCDSPEAVMQAFGEWRDRIDWIVMENDPHLRESGTLIPMLERLPQGPGNAFLYAQAKGTTRHPKHIAQHWSDTQYIVYMDYWPLVAEQLTKFPVTGAFKKLGHGWSLAQSKSEWHYSGSWFWARNDVLFSRDWRFVEPFWSAIETYPSTHFYTTEAACLFMEARVFEMNLYRHHMWRRIVDPTFRAWRKENKRYENPF